MAAQKVWLWIKTLTFSSSSARKVICKMKSSKRGCFALWKWFLYTWCMITEWKRVEIQPTDVPLLISENVDSISVAKMSKHCTAKIDFKISAGTLCYQDFWPLAFIKSTTTDLHIKLKQKLKVWENKKKTESSWNCFSWKGKFFE